MLWSAAYFYVLAVLFVVMVSHGVYKVGSSDIFLVAGAVLLCVWITVRQLLVRNGVDWAFPRVGLWLLAVGAVWGSWAWVPDPLYKDFARFVVAGLGVALAIAGLGGPLRVLCKRVFADTSAVLRDDGRIRRWFWPSLLGLSAVYNYSIVPQVPRPHIDVWPLMHEAGDLLLQLQNPYDHYFPDFYGGRTQYGLSLPGFTYPPVVLLIATLSRVFHVDVRLLLISCLMASGVLAREIALLSGWGPTAADLLGFLLLFVPRQGFVLKYAFSEPVTGLLLTTAVYSWQKGSRAPALALLGTFLSSKQYLGVLGPLALFFAGTWRNCALLCVAVAVPWLPFILWNPRALWQAVVGVLMNYPPRKDAMTLSAWLMGRNLLPLPRWLSQLTGALVGLAHGWHAKWSAWRLCIGCGCALLVAYFFMPQAFANYYALVTWVFILGFACAGPVSQSCGQ